MCSRTASLGTYWTAGAGPLFAGDIIMHTDYVVGLVSKTLV